jgi:hypothetical protein
VGQVDDLIRLALLSFFKFINFTYTVLADDELGYSQVMFSFDYKVDLSPLFGHLFSRAILPALHCFFFIGFNE